MQCEIVSLVDISYMTNQGKKQNVKQSRWNRAMSGNTQLPSGDVVLYHREQKPWKVSCSDYCLHFRVASLADKPDRLDSKDV